MVSLVIVMTLGLGWHLVAPITGSGGGTLGSATASTTLDCTGECACVEPDEEEEDPGPARCLYWPDGAECMEDCDCIEDEEDPADPIF